MRRGGPRYARPEGDRANDNDLARNRNGGFRFAGKGLRMISIAAVVPVPEPTMVLRSLSGLAALADGGVAGFVRGHRQGLLC